MNERRFRDAMGTFLTGVAVITTKVENDIHGMTANSVTSVSLKPPLILISIDEKAQMLEKINRSKRFGLSILAAHQLDISMHFAGQKKRKERVDFDWIDDMPVVPGALSQLACTVDKAIAAGDHTLFVSKVDDIYIGEDKEPLIFFRGKYQSSN